MANYEEEKILNASSPWGNNINQLASQTGLDLDTVERNCFTLSNQGRLKLNSSETEYLQKKYGYDATDAIEDITEGIMTPVACAAGAAREKLTEATINIKSKAGKYSCLLAMFTMLLPFVAIILYPINVVLAVKAIRKLKNEGNPYKLVIAGLVVSTLFFVANIIAVVMLIITYT